LEWIRLELLHFWVFCDFFSFWRRTVGSGFPERISIVNDLVLQIGILEKAKKKEKKHKRKS